MELWWRQNVLGHLGSRFMPVEYRRSFQNNTISVQGETHSCGLVRFGITTDRPAAAFERTIGRLIVSARIAPVPFLDAEEEEEEEEEEEVGQCRILPQTWGLGRPQSRTGEAIRLGADGGVIFGRVYSEEQSEDTRVPNAFCREVEK
ncbi:hypothetical protein CYMTET_47630 [Cymbomonas tetramitiformis]|uniref:Uncharacterized protein n=1 Tax=Cymbomonas tetramitiformis TaxID=36881 RepID=A0AAE0BVL6_9CHLO|nr:hypothetical protein CYMTET_47630 [Cymbomonas tetramitiformis]